MTDAYYYGKKAREAREAWGPVRSGQKYTGQSRTRTGNAPYRPPKRTADPGAVPLANKGNRLPVQPDNAMKGRRLGGRSRPGGSRTVRSALTGRTQQVAGTEFGGGSKVQRMDAVQGVLQDMKTGPDPSQVVSSGAMIRARRRAEQERALMDARQQLGVVPPPPGRGAGKGKAAGTPEQQAEKFKTIGDRFGHAWKMDDITRAREHIEDWFAAGGNWDNMPAQMEYLARQIVGAQGGQTAVEKGLAGEAAEVAEEEAYSDLTRKQAQEDRVETAARLARGEARTIEGIEADKVAAEQKVQADIAKAATTARGKAITNMESTLAKVSGPALKSYYDKVLANTTPEERESMPTMQALASRIAAGEDVFAPGMPPKRAERYATLTQSLMEGGEYMETGKSTTGTNILVKRLTKEKAVPVLSMADWPTDVKADKLAGIHKAADREKFMMEGNDKYIGMNGVHKRLFTSMYRDAKTRGLSDRQAKKFAEKHAQDIFLGYLAKNAELYNIFVNSPHASKKINKKKAAEKKADYDRRVALAQAKRGSLERRSTAPVGGESATAADALIGF